MFLRYILQKHAHLLMLFEFLFCVMLFCFYWCCCDDQLFCFCLSFVVVVIYVFRYPLWFSVFANCLLLKCRGSMILLRELLLQALFPFPLSPETLQYHLNSGSMMRVCIPEGFHKLQVCLCWETSSFQQPCVADRFAAQWHGPNG